MSNINVDIKINNELIIGVAVVIVVGLLFYFGIIPLAYFETVIGAIMLFFLGIGYTVKRKVGQAIKKIQ